MDNNIEEIKKAIKLLEDNNYIVKRLTRYMKKDRQECDESNYQKECVGCSCCVCIIQ
jgi:hypothetical protein